MSRGSGQGVQPGAWSVDDVHVTRRPATALHPVAVLSRWTGFCLPCGDEARPLVLTWTGLRGVRAWLAGSSFSDGELRLTCACCGGVDVVGWEDEPALPEAAPEVEAPRVPERVEAPDEQPVLLPAGPVVVAPPVREVHAELQALLGRVDVPVTWHEPEAQPAPDAPVLPVLETGPPVQAAAAPVQAAAAPVQAAAAPVQADAALGQDVPVAAVPVQDVPVPAADAPVPPAPRAEAPLPPAVVRVVQVLDLDAPAAGALRAVAEVPPPRQPSRAERRAAERAARRAPAPRGASDEDALDLLDLVG